jgi:maltooligosyltrehalose trehalohydrolase
VNVETRQLTYGASIRDGGLVEFRVWAPNAASVRVRLNGNEYAMQRAEAGEHSVTAPGSAGERYFYLVDGHKPVPDPVSRLLPDGVHGPTQIVDPNAFTWNDGGWRGRCLEDLVIYELHVGTFTPRGTFGGVMGKLDYLLDLGITAIEIMPVAAFPGTRNWGYDGVSMYAVQNSYGGPDGLKALVDAAHAKGLAVLLDVVYNHLGNEGNYLRMFGPYFTDRHQTPWGEAVNYDGPDSEGVRRYVVNNALYWLREYHLDGLRLDAVQTIYDDSAPHILAEITAAAAVLSAASDRELVIIAETDENDRRHLLPREQGGYGFHAVWSDDFHHSVHAYFTGENRGYYQDFGKPEQIVRALNEGFVFQGEQFRYWDAPRGTSSEGLALTAHVVAAQNHDQIGNRAVGERLSHLISRGAVKLAAALVLLAPETPLLFMGEEFAARSPFQFFTSYADPQLQQAVREGRRREFQAFGWQAVPDPEDPVTFERSRLDWNHGESEKAMLQWYHALLEVRKRFVLPSDRTCRAQLRDDGTLLLQVPAAEPNALVVAALKGKGCCWRPGRGWHGILHSDEDGYFVGIYERR